MSPDDYDPPQYEDYAATVSSTDSSSSVTDDDITTTFTNVTQEIKLHRQRSEAFVAQTAVVLNAFAELQQDEE